MNGTELAIGVAVLVVLIEPRAIETLLAIAVLVASAYAFYLWSYAP